MLLNNARPWWVFVAPLGRFACLLVKKALSAVVVDEMHLIGDTARGFLLELMLTKQRLLCPNSVQVRSPKWHVPVLHDAHSFFVRLLASLFVLRLVLGVGGVIAVTALGGRAIGLGFCFAATISMRAGALCRR